MNLTNIWISSEINFPLLRRSHVLVKLWTVNCLTLRACLSPSGTESSALW